MGRRSYLAPLIMPTTSCASSVADVLADQARFHVVCERAETFLDSLPDGCVSLMPLDFPYFRVKSEEAWDNAWPTPEAFIEWMGGILAKCRRVLAPNGSIYVFAAPQVRGGLTMATRVECEVARHFDVLSSIVWVKPDPGTDLNRGAGRSGQSSKKALRTWFPLQERIIFGEQFGSDVTADDASGYTYQCEVVKRSVFGDYLRGEIERAQKTAKEVAALFPSRTGGSTGCVSNWLLGLNCPTPEQWDKIRSFLNANGGDFLGRSYEDLRRQYEDLRRQYEALRRPFAVSAEVPYTDVWTYPTVSTYPGKHPCEKPDDMARDLVRASSRPGEVVADFFCGSGKFLAAAVAEGRRAIGCDMDPHWAEQSRRRCEAALATGRIVRTSAPKADKDQMNLIAV